MYAADAVAIASGIAGIQLMEAAGRAVADDIRIHYTLRTTVVLCGPGNNGGDGFVVARLLEAAGWPVQVALLGDRAKLGGDAALAAAAWPNQVLDLAPEVVTDADLVIDAVFGAGLSREVDGIVRQTLEAVTARGARVVAIDIPSGVDGDTGAVLGYALEADRCVTFFRKKTGHCLFPGRSHCGDLRVANIGIADRVIETIRPPTWENHPDLWKKAMRWPGPESHKYTRGFAVVVSGGAETTGAPRLAARAALRAGAGVVTVACPLDAFPILAASLTSVMTRIMRDVDDLRKLAADRRCTACLIGPGNGANDITRRNTLALLELKKPCVIDADALSVFENAPRDLFAALNGDCVLTPHDGEFARVFGGLPGSRLDRARAAAAMCGAVVLLKGGDTVVASPDGRATITTNAPPDLATAGAGDVLAGIVVGLLAQGIPAFQAACAGVWLHADAAHRFGLGLIAEDLSDHLPLALRHIRGLAS
ncbi:MAG: NAD(P)H-hydrate dehydratase [Alphaproteobacteria bacterium]|nr:NAD(P)H-hydrate dehydratase [Alphaproteobacteria bacterium]